MVAESEEKRNRLRTFAESPKGEDRGYIDFNCVRREMSRSRKRMAVSHPGTCVVMVCGP